MEHNVTQVLMKNICWLSLSLVEFLFRQRYDIRDMPNNFKILIFAVLAEFLFFLMVADCAPSRPREGKQVPGDSRKGPGSPTPSQLPAHRVTRHYRVGTRCSVGNRNQEKAIRILSNGSIDAKGDINDKHTDIILISVDFHGLVEIKSAVTDHYLCFTKRGKLTTKQKIRKDPKLCQFYETAESGYFQYRSAYNSPSSTSQILKTVPLPFSGQSSHNRKKESMSSTSSGQHGRNSFSSGDWFVGFSPSGKPLHGSLRPNNSKCFDLIRHPKEVEQPEPKHAWSMQLQEYFNRRYMNRGSSSEESVTQSTLRIKGQEKSASMTPSLSVSTAAAGAAVDKAEESRDHPIHPSRKISLQPRLSLKLSII